MSNKIVKILMPAAISLVFVASACNETTSSQVLEDKNLTASNGMFEKISNSKFDVKIDESTFICPDFEGFLYQEEYVQKKCNKLSINFKTRKIVTTEKDGTIDTAEDFSWAIVDNSVEISGETRLAESSAHWQQTYKIKNGQLTVFTNVLNDPTPMKRTSLGNPESLSSYEGITFRQLYEKADDGLYLKTKEGKLLTIDDKYLPEAADRMLSYRGATTQAPVSFKLRGKLSQGRLAIYEVERVMSTKYITSVVGVLKENIGGRFPNELKLFVDGNFDKVPLHVSNQTEGFQNLLQKVRAAKAQGKMIWTHMIAKNTQASFDSGEVIIAEKITELNRMSLVE